MSIETYVINDVDIRSLKDSIGDLQKIFNELTYSHLPVEDEGVYLGCISENDVRCFDSDKKLEDYQYALEGFFARSDDYWLDTLQVFAQNNTNLLPVLDSANQYMGYLELSDIINHFNETPFLSEPGGIIILEKGERDYSFSEIGQITESHNAALLGIFVSSKDSETAQITLKVSTSASLNDILQTFRRYEYNVVSEHPEDRYRKSLEARSEYLDKYLKI
jgi:signal-transduction protein with cAMP-binding, CBS, and nucleotidyltransferase domain